MMRRACLLLLACAATATAAPIALPPPPAVALSPAIGTPLPLDAGFIDDDGRPAPLGHWFGTRPVVLVPGYYRCPNLCSTVMEGVFESLASTGLPPDAYHVVAVSIDPSESPAIASAKKAAYASLVAHAGGDLHLLTGPAPAVARLAHSLGLRYTPDAGQFAHAAGFVVATPDGRVSQVFTGVRFTPRDLRLALVEASDGRLGTVSDRIALLCAHYDPRAGRHTGAAMNAVRAACLLVLAAVPAWIWRRRRTGNAGRAGRPAR